MDDQIIPADKRQRRLALLAAASLTLLGLLTLAILHVHLREVKKLAEQNVQAAEHKVLRVAMASVWVGGLSLVGVGAWLWRLGRRINLADRFPPPGMKLLRDTRVRTGPRARALANLAQAGSLLCVVAGTVGMWYLYRLVADLLRS